MEREVVIKLLKKQFELVGRKYRKSYTDVDGWYTKHSWDREKKDRFKKFFIRTLNEDLGWSKHKCECEFMWWDLSFGWQDAR
jgi:hypothetical protein